MTAAIRFRPLQNQILRMLVLATMLSLVLLVPEGWLALVSENFHPRWSARVLLAVLLFNVLVLGCRSKKLAYTGLIIIYLLQLSAMLHLSYFGSFYTPAQVPLLFEDTGEIVESSMAALGQILPPILIVGLSLAAYHFIYRRTTPGLQKSLLFDALLVAFLIAPAVAANGEQYSRKYEPDGDNLALKNGLFAVSYFLGNELPNRLMHPEQLRTYQPYVISRLPERPKQHVILILGESTTYKHWHLYGYDKQTSPRLDALAQDPGFHKRIAIASAVSTRSSIPLFLNSQREPDNYRHMASHKAALFRLAKEAGYQTVFLSTQIMDGISSAISIGDIDIWREIGQVGRLDGRLDHRLISAIDAAKIDWSRPVFLVLNPRCCHSPYDVFAPPNGSVFAKGLNTNLQANWVAAYDDAMLYLDGLIADIIEHVNSRRTQVDHPMPTTFVMVSDHGQKLGEDHQYGHGHLDITTALTPLLIYAPDPAPPEEIDDMQQLPCVVPQYEAARFIAQLMGYRIENPNADGVTYFVNGIDIAGRAGFLDYNLQALSRTICSK